MSLRELFGGWATLMPPVGGETWRELPIWAPNRGKKKKSNGAPKSTLTPLLIGNRAMRSPLGMFVFNFDQKVDVTPPPTPLFRGQNQFFLGDVFIFCLDFFDMLNGSS